MYSARTVSREARTAPRVAAEAFVIARADGGEELVFRTRDVSLGGLFLFTRLARAYRYQVGTRLSLDVHDEAASFQATGVVVRVVEAGSPEAEAYPTGFGVRIVPASEADRERLAQLVASRAGAPT